MTKIIGNVESWHWALWNCTERGSGSAEQQLLQTGKVSSEKGWRQLQLSSFCRFISSGVEQFCPSEWFVVSSPQTEGFCLSPAAQVLDLQFFVFHGEVSECCRLSGGFFFFSSKMLLVSHRSRAAELWMQSRIRGSANCYKHWSGLCRDLPLDRSLLNCCSNSPPCTRYWWPRTYF